MFKKTLFTVLLVSSSLFAQNEIHYNESMGVQTLSSQLRGVLSQEMLALEKAMKEILSSMLAGDYETIEKTAVNIKNSFILKQKITSSQKKELHTKLPQNFIEQDRAFHNDAQMLQHVSSMKNPELTSFYFNKMLNACVSCHQTFAQEKFLKFESLSQTMSEDHH